MKKRVLWRKRFVIVACLIACVGIVPVTGQTHFTEGTGHAVLVNPLGPQLITIPAVTVARGASVNLYVVVRDGAAPLAFHWSPVSYENDAVVPDSTSQLAMITPSASGSYRCEVTDALGRKAEITTTITVVPSNDAKLRISRAQANGKDRTVDFRVLCCEQACAPVFGFTKNDLLITEGGTEIKDYTLNAMFWNPLSAALVLDVSGSMAGAPLDAVKSGASMCVANMDGALDEVALLSFSTYVTMEQAMTTSRMMLDSAIAGLQNQNMTAAWDAAITGIEELVRAASNPNRVVVLMTDGGDNSSTHTPAEVIAEAQAHAIHVYTIALGGVTSVSELQSIATATGGEFLRSPTPAELVAVFGRIFAIVKTTPGQDCRVTWRNEAGNAPPGTTVTITSRNLCDNIAATASTGFVTGVAAVPDASAMRLYPNPSNGSFTLALPQTAHGALAIRVSDLLGRTVYDAAQNVATGSATVGITLPAVPPGLYFVRATVNGATSTQKVRITGR